jgi:crossover junction endodeoxyribonuclease RusA
MLPFEFTVDGPPISHQTRNSARLRAWQRTVRVAAVQRWPAGTAPVIEQLRFIVTYYHDGASVRIDNDNLVKPIQDALNGPVYVDDR